MCSSGLMHVGVYPLHRSETSISPVPQHPSLAYLNPVSNANWSMQRRQFYYFNQAHVRFEKSSISGEEVEDIPYFGGF